MEVDLTGKYIEAERSIILRQYIAINGSSKGFNFYKDVLGDRYEKEIEDILTELKNAQTNFQTTVFDKIIDANYTSFAEFYGANEEKVRRKFMD